MKKISVFSEMHTSSVYRENEVSNFLGLKKIWDFGRLVQGGGTSRTSTGGGTGGGVLKISKKF